MDYKVPEKKAVVEIYTNNRDHQGHYIKTVVVDEIHGRWAVEREDSSVWDTEPASQEYVIRIHDILSGYLAVKLSANTNSENVIEKAIDNIVKQAGRWVDDSFIDQMAKFQEAVKEFDPGYFERMGLSGCARR